MTNQNSQESFSESIVEDNQEEENFSEVFREDHGNSIGFSSQLLLTLIPIVLIPLTIASFIGYRNLYKNAEQQLKQQLQNEAILARKTFNLLIKKAKAISVSIQHNPAIIEAVKAGTVKVTTEKLSNLPLKQVETNFAATKLLQPNLALNNYLKQTANSNGFAEIFITEKYGFNVAYSQPTSDFVQHDEPWWQRGTTKPQYLEQPSLDASTNIYSMPLITQITDPQSGAFLGVIRGDLSLEALKDIEVDYLNNISISGAQQVQLVDFQSNRAINTIDSQGGTQEGEIIGREAIAQIGKALQDVSKQESFTVEEILSLLPNPIKLKEPQIIRVASETNASIFSFIYGDRQYTLAPIPNTTIFASASIDRQEIEAAGNEIIFGFLLTALILLILLGIAILLVARQITNPLRDLTFKAQLVVAGNLDVKSEAIDVKAKLQGSRESIALAHSFNNLIQKVRELLKLQNDSLEELEQARKAAETLAKEQSQKNQKIQEELLELLVDVEGASSGDLTVRSRINEGEIGIVADFFNSIIENLRDIVSQVKQTAEQVNTSIDDNQGSIAQLTNEAVQQAEQIALTLASVEQMTQSIQQVAFNAQEAAKVARIASNKAETGGENVNRTATSMVQLRETIDETSTKVKRLGDASQQISRVISLINQIALQTNLLAINASIEAARAGEEGKGFAVVAEEVGALAAQSAEATKEVENIVATIRKEIAQVIEIMEVGTTQAEEGTHLVASSKDSLEQIMDVSQQIDRLVQAISETTVSQTQTSDTVTTLMEKIARISQKTSITSQEVSNSLEATVVIAEKLQSSVDTFKVAQE